jgi:hypothetical protein
VAELQATPVQRNLRFRAWFYGIGPLELPFMLVPAATVGFICEPLGLSSGWALITAVGIGAALVVLKWNKPDDYVETLLMVAFSPRRLSHKEKESLVAPCAVRLPSRSSGPERRRGRA